MGPIMPDLSEGRTASNGSVPPRLFDGRSPDASFRGATYKNPTEDRPAPANTATHVDRPPAAHAPQGSAAAGGQAS